MYKRILTHYFYTFLLCSLHFFIKPIIKFNLGFFIKKTNVVMI